MEMESPMLHSNSLYYTNCAKTTCAIMTVGGAGAARRDKDLRSPLTRVRCLYHRGQRWVGRCPSPGAVIGEGTGEKGKI